MEVGEAEEAEVVVGPARPETMLPQRPICVKKQEKQASVSK